MKVRFITVQAGEAGQRIDNYLIKKLKGVPKARIYRALRKGEVRVNKKRIKATYRIEAADELRIPPLQVDASATTPVSASLLQEFMQQVLFEDEQLVIINKPSGFAAHKGSKVRLGVIDILREHYGSELQLVHRIDRETSGCLLLAKNRTALLELQQQLKEHAINKEYQALLQGNLGAADEMLVDSPLEVIPGAKADGPKVMVAESGAGAKSYFTTLQSNATATLVTVRLETGRMHQIRAHAQYIEHPIAGDRRYGSRSFNKSMSNIGLKRLFLHANKVTFSLFGKKYSATCKLPQELQSCLDQLFVAL